MSFVDQQIHEQIAEALKSWQERAVAAEADYRKLYLALRNVLMLANSKPNAKRGHADEVFRAHLVRFCASAGVEPNILRGGRKT